MQPLVIPQVRIDYTTTGRRRLSSEFTEVSEYDLPLDSKWEFPRERYVSAVATFISLTQPLPVLNRHILVC